MDNRKIFFIILTSFLLLGIYLGISSFPICLAALALCLYKSDKDSVGVFLLMFGGTLGGITRMYYPFMPVYGILLNLAGIYLLRGSLNSFFSDCKKGMRYSLLVCLIFFVFYLLGERTAYASSKMFDIAFHGSMMLFGYYVFLTSTSLRNSDLGYILIMTSIAFMSFVIDYYGFSAGAIINYDWFRSDIMSYYYYNAENTIIGYQEVGMMALFGIAIIISDQKFEVFKALFLGLVAFQIILTSGARQAIFGFVAILFLRFVFFTEARRFKKILSIIFGIATVLISLYLILQYGDEKTTTTLLSGESDRDLIFIDALRIFSENPLFGVGLGGFASHTVIDSIAWPHNFFLEILCETGIVGSVLLFVILLNYWFKNKVRLKLLTAHRSFYFLAVAVLFLRVMVSSDLSESIELFSALFVCGTINHSYEKF